MVYRPSRPAESVPRQSYLLHYPAQFMPEQCVAIIKKTTKVLN